MISINFLSKRVFDLKSRLSSSKRKQINHNDDENFENLFDKYINNYQFKNSLFSIQISLFVDKFSSKINDIHNDIEFKLQFLIFDFRNSLSKINDVHNDIEFKL